MTGRPGAEMSTMGDDLRSISIQTEAREALGRALQRETDNTLMMMMVGARRGELLQVVRAEANIQLLRELAEALALGDRHVVQIRLGHTVRTVDRTDGSTMRAPADY